MKVVVSRRMTGKTTRTVNFMLANPGALCLVHSAMEAERLRKTYGIKPERFLLPSNYEERLRGHRNTKIVIDNLDMFLKYMFRDNPIELVTMTGDLVKESDR